MIFFKSLMRGGVHPDGQKQLSSNSEIVRLDPPRRLFISLKQHIGMPAKVIVKAGESVIAGQLIAVGRGSSANIHAPQSGIVDKIAKHRAAIPGGGEEIMIHLLCDPENNDIAVKIDHHKKGREELLNIIEEAGVVGMGGAVFPTATKLRSGFNKKIDTLLINGCECEPYLTCDDQVMRKQSVQVIGGIRYLLEVTGAAKAIIGIEDNKQQALQILTDTASEDDNIEIKSLPTHYPMGSAKQFIKALCQVEVPKGKRSTDVGVVVQNVATCAAVFNAIRFGQPQTHRVVTLSGRAIEQPMNIEAPIGSLISELVARCGGLKSKASRIVIGGPMMGHTISNMHSPIIKGTSGILLLEEDEIPEYNTSPCVSCGRCIAACPMGLMPNKMAELIENDDLQGASKQGLSGCLLCGSCAFICPASLPLTQYFTYAKDELSLRMKMENKAQLARRLNQQRSERLSVEADKKAAAKEAKKAARGAARSQRKTSTSVEQEL